MYNLYVCATGYERNTPDSMAGVCSDVNSADHEITNESGDELVEFTQRVHKARRSDQETERAANQTSRPDEAGSNSSDLPNTERSCAFTVRIPENWREKIHCEKSCNLPDTQNTNKTGEGQTESNIFIETRFFYSDGANDNNRTTNSIPHSKATNAFSVTQAGYGDGQSCTATTRAATATSSTKYAYTRSRFRERPGRSRGQMMLELFKMHQQQNQQRVLDTTVGYSMIGRGKMLGNWPM